MLVGHIQPSDLVTQQGQTVEFSCQTDVLASINWNFIPTAAQNEIRIVTGGSLVESFDNKFMLNSNATTSVLTIMEISVSDSGSYVCIENLGFGERSSSELIVLGKCKN